MIDPYVWRCTACGWTGPEERTVRDPRGGGPVCPQCKDLGYDSRVEKIALADLPPKGSER